MSAPEPLTQKQEGFYLFDDAQSGQIESFRMALRALSELTANPTEATGDCEGVARENLAALFDQLECRLGEIIGPDKVGYHMLVRTAPAAQPAERRS